MSKKSRNKRHIRAMSAPVPMPSVPRAAHVHNCQAVRTNGNRIRRGCDLCGGAWGKWLPMTDIEKDAYKPAKEETPVDGYHYDNYEQGHDNPYGKTNAQRHADHFNSPEVQETIARRKEDAATPEVSGLKALLEKAQAQAIDGATGSALNVADQAGVSVREEAGMPAFGDTTAFRRTGITDVDADAANRATWPVIDLPDGDDHSDTAIVDDFEDEEDEGHGDGDAEWVLYRAGGLHIYPLGEAPTEGVIDRGHAEYDPIADDWFVPASVCKRLGFVRTETDGYITAKESWRNTLLGKSLRELRDIAKTKGFAPERLRFLDVDGVIGLLLAKDEDTDKEEDVDDNKVAAFVAESFGEEGDQDVVNAPVPVHHFAITLDFGNDTTRKFEANSLADIMYDLEHLKRDDLEFAARKLGIRNVTTKVQKVYLVRAIIAAADTTLVKEHALNRAAVMLRPERPVGGNEEWRKHYGVSDAETNN